MRVASLSDDVDTDATAVVIDNKKVGGTGWGYVEVANRVIWIKTYNLGSEVLPNTCTVWTMQKDVILIFNTLERLLVFRQN